MEAQRLGAVSGAGLILLSLCLGTAAPQLPSPGSTSGIIHTNFDCSAVFGATKTEKSGEYICPPAIPEKGNALFQDEKLAESLMALTRKVVEEKMYAKSVKKGCPMEFY
jgi:hypothetical protein